MRGQPVSPETMIDERFDEIVAALRAEMPPTPALLQERVAAVTATPPVAPRFTARRILTFAVPAIAGLSVAVALGVGLNAAITSPSSSRDNPSAAPAVRDAQQSEPESAPALGAVGALSAQEAQKRAAAPGPATNRAQDYNASLVLLVDGTDDLSGTTQRALRTTRRLGGYVVSVNYATPEPGEGTAAIRVRIPVSRVQGAIVEFSQLGRILSQNTQISDLQQPLDEVTRQIRRLERNAVQARGADRERILAQIASLRRQRTEINRRAAFATVSLDLTTHAPVEPAPAQGRLGRALDDAVGILLAELVIAAYALIVASPFILLLVAGFFTNRAYRRHADERLLERA
jgi:uncharacterized protein DUF4349